MTQQPQSPAEQTPVDQTGSEQTLPGLLAVAAERFGEREAVVTPERTLDYRQLFDAARTFAGALVGAGVEPGDRVAVWAPNSLEWIVSFLGLSSAGAALVPINTRFKGAEAGDILRRARVRVLVTVRDFLGVDYVSLLRSTAVELPDLEAVLAVDVAGPGDGDARGWRDFVAGADAASVAEADRRRLALTADDPSDILFTSGTTGTPKGVVMTHGRTRFTATDWVEMTGLRGGDRYLMINPYFHMFGLKSGILSCVAVGATMLPEPVLDVDRVLARVEAERISVLPGPPALYQTILDHPKLSDHDLSSLRLAVTGASDIPVELIRRIHQELPFSTVIAGYGLTEGGTASGTAAGDPFEAIATTVGRLRPGFEARFVHRGEGGVDTDAAPGEAGEIWLRGPSVMAYYLDDPEATAAAVTPDGWLRTGDLGVLDGDGRLKIVGRLKDLFIVGGFNAYPAEIENLLLAHPDITQAAVIGVPDVRLGEVGMAFVVARTGASLSEAEVIAWSRDHMANYKVPRAVEVVDSLPVNATGKVHKDTLRELAAARRARGADDEQGGEVRGGRA